MIFAKSIFLLISAPTAGWAEIKKYKIPKDMMLMKVFYPLLTLIAISSFALCFYVPGNSLSYYIQDSITNVVKFFFGYLMALYFINSIFYQKNEDKVYGNRLQIFVLYIYSIFAIIGIMDNLLHNFPFIQIFPIYIIYIIYRGADYLDIQKSIPRFVAIVSAAILLPPILFDFILRMLLPK